jgi:DNA-binding NtrC family response regulator
MNVRVLAATNRDPQAAIAAGQLRADLYYRLATVVFRIPPLRDRREDIVPLAEHFLARFSAEFGRPGARFASAALDALVSYSWPGNARELRNVIERATMLCREAARIGPEDLDLPVIPKESSPPPAAGGPESFPRLDESERIHIERALLKAGGSRTRAAALLGISRSTLWDKMKRYGLTG